MKFAIDRYKIGNESEVDADEFDGQRFIPARRTRFFCPECGEIVYFRAKGGAHPNQFYHQEKTDQAPECDKRVDGRSGLSLRERIGLPLYITRIDGQLFGLNIGFPALGNDMLSKAEEAQCTVEVSYANKRQQMQVDHTRFIENETTLIPISFIPDPGRNYVITISGLSAVYGIQRKWSDYADGFDHGGAIFTYSESGGKKIRRGDCISTHRLYYLVTQDIIPCYPELIYSEEGKVTLGNNSFRIYRIEVCISADERGRYSEVSKYFYEAFGIWLLEMQPELIPLWPPMVEQDDYIPITPDASVICAISSGNESPNVYVYSERGATILPKNMDDNHLIEISVRKKPVMLSVDRKYVGREASFVMRDICDTRTAFAVEIKKENDNYKLEELHEDDFISSEFTLIANGKFDLFIGEGKQIYNHLSIRKSETVIDLKSRIDAFVLLIESGIYRHVITKKITDKQNLIDDRLLKSLIMSRGATVPIPRWAMHVIQSIIERLGATCSRELLKALSTGVIQIGALEYLKQIERDLIRM